MGKLQQPNITVIKADVLSFRETPADGPNVYADLRLRGDMVVSAHADGGEVQIATICGTGISWNDYFLSGTAWSFAVDRGERNFINGMRLKHALCLPYYSRRERLLAAVSESSGEYLVTADTPRDLDDMGCPYIVMDNVRGLYYDIDNLRPWTTRYPWADWEQVKALAVDMTCETEYARLEMNRLLGCETRESERLLARIRGAYA